jgi:uncharacterized protein (TIGR02452 family)
MAAACRQMLMIPREKAAELGRTALEASQDGYYVSETGRKVDWRRQVAKAVDAKLSIKPDAPLPQPQREPYPDTQVQVANETTLQAGQRFVEAGQWPLALNFANGAYPGGGFLRGALAQEEVLCRSSALFITLADDPMYEHHRQRPRPDSTGWAVYSPDVPVFRTDDGTALEEPWRLSFITCAAPYAPDIGQPESGGLLQQRIHRILAIAHAYGHAALVLGAWGCGAFHNDPQRTAADFRTALETDFRGCFSDIVFAVTDWSPERRFLGPFRDVFSPDESRAGR